MLFRIILSFLLVLPIFSYGSKLNGQANSLTDNIFQGTKKYTEGEFLCIKERIDLSGIQLDKSNYTSLVYKLGRLFKSNRHNINNIFFYIGDNIEEENLLSEDIENTKVTDQKNSVSSKSFIFIIILLIVLLILVFFLFQTYIRSRKYLKALNEDLEEKVIERTLNLTYEIDRHKKTEIELKKSEERWNKAQEVGKIGNWEYDLDSRTLWGSKQAFKILRLNYKKGPIYTTHILHKVHPDDFPKVIRAIRRIKSNNKKLHLEFRIKSGNVRETYVLVRAELIYNVGLNPVKISGTIQDVTNRKIVENELVKAKERAEESDRLKSAFLSNMSHEIRTPMNAIIGFSDLLADNSIDKEARMDYIQLIQSNSNKLVNLIDDIIDIAKIEANQIQIRESECELNQMMKELYKTFKPQVKEELQFNLGLPEETVSSLISTDCFRLQQVITNLLSNSLKFTNAGEIEFGYTLRKKNELEFFVRDTGIGIDEEAQKLIFERFRQVEDSNTRLYGGTGLGLAICKYLVNLMGGSIWVSSQKNKGSTFYFTLPYKPVDKTPIKEIKPIEDKKMDWADKTMLIAEDEEDSFVLLKTLLKKTHINLLHAKTGKEAVDMLESNVKIDLILMDIQMPEMDGLEATKIIKSEFKSMPIIAQTAFALPGEKQKCEEAGCDAYLTKPINKDVLFKLISRHLGE